MAIRIGSNISSLNAQRQLSDVTSALSKVTERLSTGQRINRASDDAAGLSIASALNSGKRVFTQGVRNLNDGVSALSIADATVENLTSIVTRIRELAEQSANGTFSSKQRSALDAEAQALSKEYFRISRSATFNGLNLFDGSLSQGLSLQGGYGASGSLQSSLGGVMGDGTFAAHKTYGTGGTPTTVALGDLNGDGVLDMVSADYNDGTTSVLLGKGDGTFLARAIYTVGANPRSLALGDLNNDGILDITTANWDGTASIFLGRGDGTFAAGTSVALSANAASVSLGDLNGDGVLDMVTADYGSGALSVFIGKGDGGFFAKPTLATSASSPNAVALGDLNGDGRLDIAVAGAAASVAAVFLGRGDGTFSAEATYGVGWCSYGMTLGDLNRDGVLDMVTSDFGDDTVSVRLGKGDGTFLGRTSYDVGDAPWAAALGDLNGDGALDMATVDSNGGTASVLFGKGDGTFSLQTTYATSTYSVSVNFGDLNGDGVLDMVTGDAGDGQAGVFIGNTRQGAAPLLPFSLKTQAEARQAMAPLDRKLTQLSAQRGVIGAFQSRIGSAINTLQSRSDNYAAAEARIRDAEVASESSALARLQIAQQSAAAVLAQANLQPSLALQLLRAG